MTTHTPGPWRDIDGCIETEDGFMVAIVNGEKQDYGYYRERMDEWKDNAHLIASAPETAARLTAALALVRELAEALSKANRWIGVDPSGTPEMYDPPITLADMEQFDRDADAIKAALARAEAFMKEGGQ